MLIPHQCVIRSEVKQVGRHNWIQGSILGHDGFDMGIEFNRIGYDFCIPNVSDHDVQRAEPCAGEANLAVFEPGGVVEGKNLTIECPPGCPGATALSGSSARPEASVTI